MVYIFDSFMIFNLVVIVIIEIIIEVFLELQNLVN